MLATRAIAGRIARNVVEQHRLVAGLALVEIDDAADLLLAIGAAHDLQLVGGLHLREPGAQVLLRRVGERLGCEIGGPVHGQPSFAAGRPLSRRAVERAARHGAHEIAPIIGAGVDILKRVDRRGGGLAGGVRTPPVPAACPFSAASASAMRRGIRLGAADADARLGDDAVLEPVGHERHAEREVAGAAGEFARSRSACPPTASAAAPRSAIRRRRAPSS